MRQVVVESFGGVEQLQLMDVPTPAPAPGKGQVLVRLTGIGMNHADLMARRGEYKISSGEPPFTPGVEGGGIVEAVSEGVTDRFVGQRVILTADAPRLAAGGMGGTYRSHYLCAAAQTIPCPLDSRGQPVIPDQQLGSLWLAYLTAWGCLVWKQQVQPGQWVAFPAASSGVALAGAQIVKKLGGTTLGLTTSPSKRDALLALPTARFDHLIVTHGPDRSMLPWHRDIKTLRGGRGVDVFFDPVASGAYLDTEIKCLAQHGTVWVYGLLGEAGKVDVTPLIRKHAAVRGWALAELVADSPEVVRRGYEFILAGFADGSFTQHVDRVFRLDEVRTAHEYMESGRHVGKLVLVP